MNKKTDWAGVIILSITALVIIGILIFAAVVYHSVQRCEDAGGFVVRGADHGHCIRKGVEIHP
jgi:hypothetical protein